MARRALIVLVAAALLVAMSSGCRSAAPTHPEGGACCARRAEAPNGAASSHCPDASAIRAGAAALRKCTILIPLAYNDGTPVPGDVLVQIENRLYERFGGYTVAGTVDGAVRMADGTRANDRSLVLWVAVPAERIDELRHEVAVLARELRQESIYFEISDGSVELVAPAADG